MPPHPHKRGLRDAINPYQDGMNAYLQDWLGMSNGSVNQLVALYDEHGVQAAARIALIG